MFESDLFPEEGVWRNPGDDSRRMGCYILAALGLLVGPGVTAVYVSEAGIPDDLGLKVFVGFLILFGWTISFLCGRFLRRESKQWKLRGMTADRVLAGIVTLAFGFVWIGALVFRPSPRVSNGGGAVPLALGAWSIAGALAAIAFVVGVLYALWEIFLHRTRWERSVLIREKFSGNAADLRIDDVTRSLVDGQRGVLVYSDRKGRAWKVLADDHLFNLAPIGERVDLQIRNRQCLSVRVSKRQRP